MVCGLPATLSVLVEKVATPEPLSVPLPIEVEPSSKVTTPVARVPVLVTVAVKVTFWLKAVVEAEDVRLVLVVFWVTVCVRLLDVLPRRSCCRRRRRR